MKNAVFLLCFLALASLALAAPSQFNVTNAGYFENSGYKINNMIQTPDRIYPGDEVQLRFNVQNIHQDTVTDVHLIALAPVSQSKLDYSLGTLAAQQTKDVIVDFRVPADAQSGTYDVFLYIIDQLGAQTQVGDIPLAINDVQHSNALIASIAPSGDAFAGDSKEVSVSLQNIGDIPVSNVIVQVQFSSTSSLIPVGSDRIFIDSIAAHETKSATFTIGIGASAAPGYYPITTVTNYKVNQNDQPALTQNVGIRVLSKTNLLISNEAGPAISTDSTGANSLTVTIANIGDTAVRGVSATVASQQFGFSGGSDKFIGTLNLDDSASMTVNLIPKRNAGNATSGSVEITVKYKDPLNIEHTQTQSIQVNMGGAARTGAVGVNQRIGTRANSGFTIFGYDPLYVVTGLVVIGLLYLAYRWKKRHDK